MKTVFTNDTIAHAWVHHTDGDYGRASSMFFEHDVIYSYGKHFPIARKNVLPKVHLFTSQNYSVSTSGHKNIVWSALRGNGTIFDVPDVMADTKFEHKRNYTALLPNVMASLESATRARTNKDMHIGSAHRLAAMLDDYSATFKLGYRKIQLPTDLSDIAAAVKRQQIKDKKRNAAKLAKLQRENADKIQAWVAGDAVRLPRIDKVYLRVVGDKIETSHGVDFPVADASRAFKLIKRCKDNKTSWKRNGENIGLGYYKVDAIRSNGTVVAGCHTVQYDEIERIAAIINAPIV